MLQACPFRKYSIYIYIYDITTLSVGYIGLHLALSDPRTLGDVDFTIAHPNLPKRPKLVLKILWERTAHPN